MVHRPSPGLPHVSPHVVPKASLVPGVGPHGPDEEKTAVDSSWEEENSTIDQQEMAEKIRQALAEKRRAGTSENTTGTGHTVDEPTVEDRQRPAQLLELDTSRGLARLVVESGPDAGKSFDLRPGLSVTVGRALDNHVVLTDLSVSRKHFEVKWSGAQWELIDRGSGNGTVVNGQIEDQPFKLVTGDRVEIGRTLFRFDQPGQPPRNGWAEEPSTLEGKRGVDADRLSALQTAELGAASPQESMPIPLERLRDAPDVRSQPSTVPPYADNGYPPSRGASKPMSTLTGRPPVVGPSAPTYVGDALVPPRATAPSPDLIPGLPTAPMPRLPPGPSRPFSVNGPASNPGIGVAPPMSALGLPMSQPVIPIAPIAGAMPPPRQLGPHPEPPKLAGTLQGPYAMAAHPHGMGMHNQMPPGPPRHPQQHAMAETETGISVSAPRFAPIMRHASAVAERVIPRVTRSTKLTMVIVVASLVLVASLVALAMGISGESLDSGSALPSEPPPSSSPSKAPGAAVDKDKATRPVAPSTPPIAAGSAEKASSTGDIDKAAAEKAAIDKAAAEKAAIDKAAAEKAAIDKAAAEKAAIDKAAAEKAAIDKAAAEKAAAAKTAAAKAAAAKVAEKAAAEKAAAAKAAAAREKAEQIPISEQEASSLLAKAEDQYRKKSFSAAAALLRNAMKGRSPNDELRLTAKLYEDLASSYAKAGAAKATVAYSGVRQALRTDDKLGKAHADELQTKLTALAPKAAIELVAAKQFEEAVQALRDAERLGSTSSTLAAVRSNIDAHAAQLYSEAQAAREDDPAKAKALLRKVLKLVDAGTSMYAKATKAISTL